MLDRGEVFRVAGPDHARETTEGVIPVTRGNFIEVPCCHSRAETGVVLGGKDEGRLAVAHVNGFTNGVGSELGIVLDGSRVSRAEIHLALGGDGKRVEGEDQVAAGVVARAALLDEIIRL